jgi:hypothetical protein
MPRFKLLKRTPVGSVAPVAVEPVVATPVATPAEPETNYVYIRPRSPQPLYLNLPGKWVLTGEEVMMGEDRHVFVRCVDATGQYAGQVGHVLDKRISPVPWETTHEDENSTGKHDVSGRRRSAPAVKRKG